jgi:hypothetical protein
MNGVLALAGSQQPKKVSTDNPEQFQGQVCIANIGPRERRKRLTSGIVILALGAGIAAALVVTHAHALWRLSLFVLFYSGASGVFQWREKT